jgi:hypothetical protein
MGHFLFEKWKYKKNKNDYFRFNSVFTYKNNQIDFFKKTELKLVQTDSFQFGYFITKTKPNRLVIILGMVRKSMDGAIVKQSNQSSEYVETILL